MTCHGTVKDGWVVPESGSSLPEGARVRIEIDPAEGDLGSSWLDAIMKFAGVAESLPPDMAAQHDHYLHGTPKR